MSSLIQADGGGPARRDRTRLNGLSRSVGRELERLDARGVVVVAGLQVDASATQVAMNEYTGLVGYAVFLAGQEPEAAAGLAVLAHGYAGRAQRRLDRLG